MVPIVRIYYVRIQSTLIDIPDDKGVHLKATGRNRLWFVYKYTNHYRTPEGRMWHDVRLLENMTKLQVECFLMITF
ncbi:MAG: hypothetical protein LBF68_07755 [Christensenellaceae bacterium]|jgi:hypothetical protein|nr:hypothetical protein [Christensenellaceae bacterium]